MTIPLILLVLSVILLAGTVYLQVQINRAQARINASHERSMKILEKMARLRGRE